MTDNEFQLMPLTWNKTKAMSVLNYYGQTIQSQTITSESTMRNSPPRSSEPCHIKHINLTHLIHIFGSQQETRGYQVIRRSGWVHRGTGQ